MHKLLNIKIITDITEIEIFQGLSNISVTLLKYIELDNISQTISIQFPNFLQKKFTIFHS